MVQGQVHDPTDEQFLRFLCLKDEVWWYRLRDDGRRRVLLIAALLDFVLALVVEQRVRRHPEEKMIDALVLVLVPLPLLGIDVAVEAEEGLASQIVCMLRA